MTSTPRTGARRIVTTSGLVAVAAAGLATAFVVGTSVGSDPTLDGQVPAGRSTVVTAAFTGTALEPAQSCDDLLEWYVDRGVDLVGPYGWGSGGYPYPVMEGDMPVAPSAAGDASRSTQGLAKAAPTTERQVNGETGTNVQEAGVDEPDAVKTDGTTLYRVDGNDLTTYDVSGAAVERLGSVDLPRMDDAEILLAGSTVVALAQDQESDEPTTRVAVVDVSSPATPEVVHTYVYDTATVSVRLIGDTVRLVLQAGLPDLDFVDYEGYPDYGDGGDKDDEGWMSRLGFGGDDSSDAERDNEDVVRESTIGDWLPTVTADDGDPTPLLGCDQVGLPDDESGLGTIAVVGFDIDEDDAGATDATDASVTGLAVDTDIAYASADRLYLATSAATAGWSECFDCFTRTSVPTPGQSLQNDDGSSHLYSFALTGRDTTYVASGEVDGLVRDRWSLDESDGVLRVAVGPSVSTDDANAVVTLGEEGDDLVERGRVDGLGRGEEIQSVRWFDGLALVVTFRQTDPLYAVDLTDPDAPRLVGELKIPGFSAYLHPLGTDRLVGLGEGPTESGGWGAQMGLFDVTDLTSPQRIALTQYGEDTYAPATSDPRQFTWLPDARTVLTVIGDYAHNTTGYVSVVHLDDGTMTNRMVEVEHGDEVSDVRLVPLADGRVVLVTGDDASFFPLL